MTMRVEGASAAGDEARMEISGLTVQFGGLVAVNDLSLSIRAGTIIGLIGPNGAGKTTTFNAITGLQPLSSGSIVVNGRTITDLPSHKRARLGIGRTFQRLELFGDMTVYETVLVGAEFRQSWSNVKADPHTVAVDAVARVGLSHVADERADLLPTGQARRVELARALAAKPRLLLLDEPASGQDADETAEFSALLRSLAAEGIGILMVEHDMGLVMAVCDHIYVLDFGSLIAEGTSEQIQNDPIVLEAYLGTKSDDGGV